MFDFVDVVASCAVSTALQAVMPVLMRCRAFLPVGVGLKVIIKDSKLLANVDKGRLGQIITNGMR